MKIDGTTDADVWAIGDAATIQTAPLPATAQGIKEHLIHLYVRLADQDAVANQKAIYLAKKLNRIVKDRASPKPFEFHNLGSLAYIGDWFVLLSSDKMYLT